jgi:hypothetical protein
MTAVSCNLMQVIKFLHLQGLITKHQDKIYKNLTDCNYWEVERKIYRPVKDEESCRIRMYKEINDILQWPDIIKFVKSLTDGVDILEG